jgi:hypothetical protein
MCGPHAVLVCTWVELEHVWYTCCLELVIQALVLRAEARITFPNVEGEEGRASLERAP